MLSFVAIIYFFFFFSSRRRHTRWPRDWSSDVCSSDLPADGRPATTVGTAPPIGTSHRADGPGACRQLPRPRRPNERGVRPGRAARKGRWAGRGASFRSTQARACESPLREGATTARPQPRPGRAGLASAGELPLDRGDLRQPAHVAFLAGVARTEERREHLRGDQRADDPPAHAEHVAVVVLDGLVARVGVVADEGADAGELAGRDRHARARAADDHRALRLPGEDQLGRAARHVRVVDGVRGVRAQIDRLVPERGDRLEHELLEREAGMVERAGDLHEPPSSPSGVHSWAAIRAAPSTPARGPWRASRILVFVPTPGSTCRNATRLAGSSSRSPAVETPPPITTSSGS